MKMGITSSFRRVAPVNYEGSWNHYARMWSRRHPGLAHIGDEWDGSASGGDTSGKMLAATRKRLGDDGVRYVKLDGKSLDGVAAHSADVFFSFDTMVHIEPRDIFNYLTRIPRLMRGRRLCILNHMNVLSERGWARFLRELDKNLMGRHGTAFSVMTDGIMQRFLDHLGYEVIEKDTTSIPRDCVWVVRAPADNG